MTEESIHLSCRTKNFIDTFGLARSTQYYLKGSTFKVLPSRFYLKGSTFFIDSGPDSRLTNVLLFSLKCDVMFVCTVYVLVGS
jgi:hypothetical protein